MIKIHNDLIQGSDLWLDCRRGLLTASEMKNIITPAKLKYAENDKQRSHLYELVAQRITGYVEPMYIGDDMLRGMEDEVYARALYAEKYESVEEVGFITNDKWGFTLGCSPDGLVGELGGIECKSRRQKYQIETIVSGEMPIDYLIQVQSCMLISERPWWDFISYCAGMPMFVKRVYADMIVQDAIVEAAQIFHGKMDIMIKEYGEKIIGLYPTERRIEEEITITSSEGEF